MGDLMGIYHGGPCFHHHFCACWGVGSGHTVKFTYEKSNLIWLLRGCARHVVYKLIRKVVIIFVL